MNLHQILLRTGLGIALLLGASQASAAPVTLRLLPAVQNAIPSQTVNLALTINGLGDHAAPSLSGFDINLSFDSSILTFTGHTLGSLLGAVDDVEASDLSLGASGNTINLAELSYLLPTELATLQPSEFTFATLSFRVDNLPQFKQTFVFFESIKVLSDENGEPLQIASLNGAQIGNPIPEPPAILLFGLGLALLIRNRRRDLVA